jgi:hypothetical protein
MYNRIRKTDGQVLIVVTLAMVLLLLFVSLAIDVGHLYGQRRHMQNAADAGALAWAHEVCFPSGVQGRTPLSQALDYAEANGADRDLTEVASDDGWTVTVTAWVNARTYIAGIIGLDQVEVNAVARAGCGAATTACGLWPIALDEEVWAQKSECGSTFIIWQKDFPDCNACNCDVDGDGEDDILLEARTWVDFSWVLEPGVTDPCVGSGIGCAEIKYLLEGYNQHGEPCLAALQIPGCAENAVGAGVCQAGWLLAGKQTGRIVSFPLYDYLGGDCLGGPNTPNFHLSGFGCAMVKDVNKLEGCPSSAVIVMEVVCDENGNPPPECSTDCGSTSGGPPGPGDVRAVNLLP